MDRIIKRPVEPCTDKAMHRWYTSRRNRFDQPDPSDGSYDLSNPQSLNRYSYVENDPVNFIDPSGLFRYTGSSINWNALAFYFSFVGYFESLQGDEPTGPGEREPQEPGRKHRPAVKSDIVVADTSGSFDQILDDLIAAILEIANNQRCSDAFKNMDCAYLTTLYLVVSLELPLRQLYSDPMVLALSV